MVWWVFKNFNCLYSFNKNFLVAVSERLLFSNLVCLEIPLETSNYFAKQFERLKINYVTDAKYAFFFIKDWF